MKDPKAMTLPEVSNELDQLMIARRKATAGGVPLFQDHFDRFNELNEQWRKLAGHPSDPDGGAAPLFRSFAEKIEGAENPEKVIKHLRKAFELSTAAFNFARQMQQILSGKIAPTTPMHHLHQDLLTELYRDEPSYEMIDHYLHAMQYVAEKTNQDEK